MMHGLGDDAEVGSGVGEAVGVAAADEEGRHVLCRRR